MCDPTIALAVVSAAGAAQQAQEQGAAAKAQYKAEAGAIKQRQQQEAVSTRSQLLDAGLNALRASSGALVGSAEAGVAGSSPVRQLAAISTQQSMGIDRIATNYEFTSQALDTQRRAAKVTQRANTPSRLSTGLRIAAAGYSGYATGKDLFG